jgi:hypothetical protein
VERATLDTYLDILGDAKYLIQKGDFPFWKQEGERTPEDYHFSWKSPELSPSGPIFKKPRTPLSTEKNASCKLCSAKLGPIKGFVQPGNFPVLILHYTGEFRKGQKPFFKRQGQTFRTTEAENLMDRLIRKVFELSFSDFYFQEFPGCMFNHDASSLSDWETRLNHCWQYVEETVRENSIKGIIITGSAAVLKYGKDKALELTGQIQNQVFAGSTIPLVVLRSPEGILHLEEKRKKLESKKSSPEYQKARAEENSVKENIVKYMSEFKSRL